MPEVHGKPGCESCPDSWFVCVGNSAHPGAGEGKPRSHKSHGGILLFYFQPCFLRHKGLRIRCISEAYLCEYFTAYPSRTKSFKPFEVYPSRALSPHVTVWLLAAAVGASCHQLPIFPPCAAPQPLCGHSLPATSALHAGAAGCAAACSAASQLLVGCICAAVSQPIVCIPLTHVQSLGCGQSTLALPGPKNEEHLSFLWDINEAWIKKRCLLSLRFQD